MQLEKREKTAEAILRENQKFVPYWKAKDELCTPTTIGFLFNCRIELHDQQTIHTQKEDNYTVEDRPGSTNLTRFNKVKK